MKLISKKSAGMCHVYDIEVDQVHNFYANRVNVHNCATAGGVSVIKHDGTVVNSINTSAASGLNIGPAPRYDLRISGNNSGSIHQNAGPIGSLGSSFSFLVFGATYGNLSIPWLVGLWGTWSGSVGSLSAQIASQPGYEGGVSLALTSFQTVVKPLHTIIRNTYNTGYMVGDIRRCYLAGTVAGVVSNPSTLPDRSYKAATATVYGSLTAAPVATGAQLVSDSGFSASNYLREPYSADLDVGTGEFSFGAVAALPQVLSPSLFPIAGANVITNGDFAAGETGWTIAAGWSISGGAATHTTTGSTSISQICLTIGVTYRIRMNVSGGIVNVYAGGSSYALGITGAIDIVLAASATNMAIQTSTVGVIVQNVSYIPVGLLHLVNRAYSTGPSFYCGVDGVGRLSGVANDGTTTRTVTSPAAYNTNTLVKVVANYRAGRLALEINGIEVAATNGAPLLTLNNSNAVLTIGNSYALDAPFPGSITMLKIGATVPTPEQSLWMYEQEKPMFREGAQVCLPEATTVSDLTYDPQTDKWVAVQAGNESSWVSLTRVSTSAPSAGTFSKSETKSGIKLLSRATTSPGVDVSISGQTLIESLSKRAEAAYAQSRQTQVFDFDTASFTAAMTNGSPIVTASSIVGTPYIGMGVTGAGIPANTTIIGINGASYVFSANCTATGSNAVGQSTFTLVSSWTAIEVRAAGASKREGATKDWTRAYDGFRETIKFAVSPGSAAWVQITARKDS